MTDQNTPDNEAPVEEDTNADEQDQNPAGEQPEDNEGTDDESESGDESKDDKGGDELPEWARTKLTKANGEAANYRTKLREAEDKLKDAKSLEEVDEIVNTLKAEREASERALLIENVALKNGLPNELAELLKGDTRDELEAHAQKLKKFAPSDEEDEDITLEGGLTPRGRDEGAEDPRALAKQFGRGSRRR